MLIAALKRIRVQALYADNAALLAPTQPPASPSPSRDHHLPAVAAAVVARAPELSARLQMGDARSAGSLRVAILEVVAAAAALPLPAVDASLVHSGCMQHAVTLFFSLPFNCIVHVIVSGMLRDSIQAAPTGDSMRWSLRPFTFRRNSSWHTAPATHCQPARLPAGVHGAYCGPVTGLGRRRSYMTA